MSVRLHLSNASRATFTARSASRIPASATCPTTCSGLLGLIEANGVVRPNFFPVDNDRIFLTQSGAGMLDRRAHAFLILFVGEIHKRRVFIGIARRRIERSAVRADLELARRRSIPGGRDPLDRAAIAPPTRCRKIWRARNPSFEVFSRRRRTR